MLQQTTVATVILYYKKWIKIFPTVKNVAQAPVAKVLKAWQGLGYYQRARNIHKTACIISGFFGAKLPCDYETLRKLPGFGPYTTGAVLSIAFDKRFPIIDANVRRVLMRVLALKGLADTSRDKIILDFLDKVLPQRKVGIFNQALMELGALVCRSSEPLCYGCPVKSCCQAYKKDLQDVIPTPRIRDIKKIEAVAAVIRHRGRYFIQQRRSSGLLAGLWEFPGGKIEREESPRDALRRELKEELGVDLVQDKYLLVVKHAYTKFKVWLQVCCAEVKPLPKTDKTHKWVRYGEFRKYPLPSATAKIVEYLKKNKKFS
jgi:A/G-specific adenine glycosylase